MAVQVVSKQLTIWHKQFGSFNYWPCSAAILDFLNLYWRSKLSVTRSVRFVTLTNIYLEVNSVNLWQIGAELLIFLVLSFLTFPQPTMFWNGFVKNIWFTNGGHALNNLWILLFYLVHSKTYIQWPVNLVTHINQNNTENPISNFSDFFRSWHFENGSEEGVNPNIFMLTH